MAARNWLFGCIAALALGCGSNGGTPDANDNGTMDDAGGFTGADAFINLIDAPPFSGMCTIGGTAQCADCVDNDGDMKIDGFDPECSGPLDRLEDSFATGIPGDNMDATYQDCFFDGDSGGGNDGCSQHVCCLLQAANIQECAALAPNSNYSKYVKSKCYMPVGNVAVPSKCSMNCGPLAPPGCDCFGCCTVCSGTQCRDIAQNPAISPLCDQSNINDPGADGTLGTADDPCKACVKTADCGSSECAYDGVSCTPCPGQCDMNGVCSPALPSNCTGATCPEGYMACQPDGTCPAETYCSSGCCVGMLF